VTKSFADEIGADAYGKDVSEIAAVAEKLMGMKRGGANRDKGGSTKKVVKG